MKKTISLICVLALINYIGCSSKEVISKNTFLRNHTSSNKGNSKNIYVNTVNDDQYFFESEHYTFEKDSLSGIGQKIFPTNQKYFNGKIAYADILTVEQQTSDTGNTVILVVGILVAGALIYVGIAAALLGSVVNDVTH